MQRAGWRGDMTVICTKKFGVYRCNVCATEVVLGAYNARKLAIRFLCMG